MTTSKEQHLILTIIGVILLTAVYLFLCWYVMWEPWKLNRVEWTPAEKAMVIKKMKYRGISGCIQDGNGYYFIQDGKRCKL